MAGGQTGAAVAAELDRAFGAPMLTLVGVGAVIGAGIFVITGQAAALYAGPAVILSFVIAAIACAFAALCYAEMGAMIPSSGSAYSFADAAFGRKVGWMIGWALIAEYLFAMGAIGIGWSAYMQGFVGDYGIVLPARWAHSPLALSASGFTATGATANIPAMVIIALATLANLLGTRRSAGLNAVIVLLKVSAVILFIVFGLLHANPAHWTPFLPERSPGPDGAMAYGISGVVQAAGVIFFAYLGFDSLTTAAQETRNPQRTLPIAILSTLVITTILYMGVARAMTGLADYRTLNSEAPLSTALAAAGPSLAWLKSYLGLSVMIGLWAGLWTVLFALSRMLMSLALGRLLPAGLAVVEPVRRVPRNAVLLSGGVGMLVAGFLPVSLIGELISTGTLLAFATVCAAVIRLRFTRPDAARFFRVPLWKVVAPLGILSSLFLLGGMGVFAVARILLWQAVGALVLFLAAPSPARASH